MQFNAGEENSRVGFSSVRGIADCFAGGSLDEALRITSGLGEKKRGLHWADLESRYADNQANPRIVVQAIRSLSYLM